MYNINSLDNCLSLIERHAPRLLREGGGSLIGDKEMFTVQPEHVAKILELYHRGVKSRHIAQEIGCSVPTVSKYLRMNGIKGRRPLNQIYIVTPEHITRILELHAQGWSQSKISQEVGFSRPTVLKYIEQNKKQLAA